VLAWITISRAEYFHHQAMIFFRYIKKIWCLLFSLFFLLYAVSPLTYTFHKSRTFHQSRRGEGLTLGLSGLRVYLVEFIFESVSRSDDRAQESDSDTVMVRKKRALVPESSGEKLLSSGQIPFHENCRFALLKIASHRQTTVIPFHRVSHGSLPLYTGHSPPSTA
jgi:hypothetical protein